MAEGRNRTDKTIELPKDLVDKFNGFSIDFGGSVIKVVYLAKEDWTKEGCKASKETLGKLRLISFAREELDGCLEFLKTNCFMRRKSEDDKPIMYTCGIGGYQYGKKIEDTLSVKTQNENEMDGFKYTMQYYLNNYPLETFCVKPFTQIQEKIKHDTKEMASKFINVKDEGLFDNDNRFKEDILDIIDKEYDPAANTRPYILASFGSAWACMRCGEDNMFTGSTFTVFAGRSFLGLGSLLTGAETYEELMSLAGKGDNLKLDITFTDVGAEGQANVDKKEEQDDIYSKFTDLMPRPVFLWGKAVGDKLENFKKEDVARTLLYTMCQHLAHTAVTTMHQSKTKHIFIAGSFISHPLVQRIVAEEFEYLKWHGAMMMDGIDGDYHLHILEFGSHFGAIGSFLNGTRKAEERKLKEEQKSQSDKEHTKI